MRVRINNSNKSSKFVVPIIFLFLFIFGIVFLISLNASVSRYKDYVPTDAIVERLEPYKDSDKEECFHVYVGYTFNNVDYHDIKIQEISTNVFTEGDHLIVRVNPKDPTVCVMNFGFENPIYQIAFGLTVIPAFIAITSCINIVIKEI